MAGQPLSQSLAKILQGNAPSGLTLNRLLERTGGRGLYLVIILLALPFVLPLSVPGLSTLIGSIIALLALPLALGRQPQLPRFLGERELPPGLQQKIVGGSIKFLRLVEKIVRPRRTHWMSWVAARFVHSVLLVLLALLLALPLPSPPFLFSNSIPSYAIILLAASVMEEDGVLIWVSYAMVVVNVIFFTLIGGAVVEGVIHLWHAISHLFMAA